MGVAAEDDACVGSAVYYLRGSCHLFMQQVGFKMPRRRQ